MDEIPFSIVVAVDLKGGIGAQGVLPWRLPGELKHFKDITLSSQPGKINAVLMGRKTWESLPERFRPLPERQNIVLTRNGKYPLPAGVQRFASLGDAFKHLSTLTGKIDQVFVIGGGTLFEESLSFPGCRKIYLTRVLSEFRCDTFFPALSPFWKKSKESPVIRENTLSYRFEEWEKGDRNA